MLLLQNGPKTRCSVGSQVEAAAPKNQWGSSAPHIPLHPMQCSWLSSSLENDAPKCKFGPYYLPNKITEKLHMDACQPIPTLRFLKQCAQTDFAPLEFVQDPVTMAAGSLAPSSSRKRIKYRRLRTCGNPKVSLLSSKLGRATAMV